MGTDKRELLLVIDGKDKGAKKVLDGVADSAEGAKDDLQDMQVGLKKLDGQIADSTRKVELLRREIGKSGDLALIKDLEKAQRELNKLTKQRKILIPVELDVDKDAVQDVIDKDDGANAAGRFSVGFSQKIGPLLARAPLSPGLLAAIGPAVPLISAAVAGGVTLGLGAGAVAAGVKIAFRDPAVQAEAKSFGDFVGRTLADSALPFVPATKDAIRLARAEFEDLDDELDDIFADSSRYLRPLTLGLTGFAKNLAPGVRDAVRNAGPLIDLAREHGPKAGKALGDAFRTLSEAAADSRQTLDALLTTTEFVVPKVAELIKLANHDLVRGGISKDFEEIVAGTGELDKVIKRIDGAPIRSLDESFVSLGQSEEFAAEKAKEYEDATRRITDQNISAAEANLRYKDSLDAAKDATDRKAKVSRDEEKALLDLARSSNDATRAMLESGAAAGEVSRQQTTARDNLIRTAEKMGYSKDEARKLADQYLDVPTVVNTTFNAHTSTAEDNLRAVRDLIARIKSKKVVITVDVRGHQTVRVGGRNIPVGDLGGVAEGGYIDGPGTKGVDSVPKMLAPGEYVLDAGDVDKLGGPRAIDQWRKQMDRGLMSYRSGAAPAGGGWGGGAGGRIEVQARWVGGGGPVGDLGAALTRFIKLDVIELGGGDVQTAYGRRVSR